MQQEHNYFSELAGIDVSAHIEHKGQFSYLSWPYAVAKLRKFDAEATWEVKRFNGLPFLATDNGTFVEVSVTVKNVTLSQIHPVLDGRNRPLLAPNAFDINTSIQRALVKAIALHGLGLYIYAGEDLPVENNQGNSRPHTSGFNATSSASQPSYSQRDDRASTRVVKPVRSDLRDDVLLTPNQLRYIQRLIEETGTDVEQLLGFFGFDDLAHIPKSEVNRVIRQLETYRKEAA